MSLLFLVLGVLLLVLSTANGASLRAQWIRGSGSLSVPSRVIYIRQCGPAPSDMTLPIGNVECNGGSMENVAIACRDTHASYLCRARMWVLIGK